MIDLRLLREQPEWFKQQIAKKKFTCDIDAFLALDVTRREQVQAVESARAQQKAANSEMAQLPKGSEEFKAKTQELRQLSDTIKTLDNTLKDTEIKWRELLLTIPNVPHTSVPTGNTEHDNVTISTWGDINAVSPHAQPHYDLPWFGKLLDFPRGVKVTGAGFPFYIGDMARLVRALLQFFLEEAQHNGYVEMLPPILVNAASATATGALPDKEGQMYHAEVDDFYCIPTAEVPVTNFYRDEILEEKDLPLKHCAYTPCFRREAGSWGKDVRGLNRLHQFDKVELVKWTHPDRSFEELELLRHDAEGILQKLGLPYRVLSICTKDIGFSHSKQYDLEVWAGGQKRWLEVSSCSCFTDFQARRGSMRFRRKDTGAVEHVHTLNGSGLAIPRVLAAILENFVQADGKVAVPQVLKKWYGGDTIG